jgi:ATP-dependent Clp protease ATP-binding subunit ClpC
MRLRGLETLSARARKVMAIANYEAQRLGLEYIGTEHFLLALLRMPRNRAMRILKELGVDTEKLLLEVEQLCRMIGASEDGQVKSDMIGPVKLPWPAKTKKVVEYAIEEARALNCKRIGTEYILLGLLRNNEGAAGRILANLGVKIEDVRSKLR